MSARSLARLRTACVLLALALSAGCSAGLSEDEIDARETLARSFEGWRLVTEKDLQHADLQAWQAANPGVHPGATTGDFFGNGRKAFAFLITLEDSVGQRARLVVLAATEGRRYESIVLFTESPVERLPAIHTSRPNEYQVYLGEQAMTVPTEGVIYEKFDGQKKLFFWNVDRFQDIELTASDG